MKGGTHVLALDLGKEPSKVELLVAQASIDLHKQHLPPVDRARLYQSIQAEQGSNGKETAEAVGISGSLLTRYQYLLNLAPDLQTRVNSGQLEWTKGSLIAQATADHDQQRQMANKAQSDDSRCPGGQRPQETQRAQRQRRQGKPPQASAWAPRGVSDDHGQRSIPR